MKTFKSLTTVLAILFTTQVWAADFTIQLQPANNSVADPQVSSISNTKVDGLGSLSTKSTITNSEVADGALNKSKILNFDDVVVSAMAAAVNALQNAIGLKLDADKIPTSYKNLIINGNFSVNQRGYSSGSVISPSVYAHDRWKSVVSNSSYTFTQNPSGQEINLSGNLVQVIEGKNLTAGTYVLSWVGTATARVNVNSQSPGSSSFQASPIIITGQNSGVEMTVQFTNGTLSKVQLNKGEVAAPFEERLYAEELRLAQRYYYQEIPTYIALDGYSAAAEGYLVIGSYKHKVTMRITPTVVLPEFATRGLLGPSVLNANTPDGFSFYAISTGVGRMILGGANTILSANAEY